MINNTGGSPTMTAMMRDDEDKKATGKMPQGTTHPCVLKEIPINAVKTPTSYRAAVFYSDALTPHI